MSPKGTLRLSENITSYSAGKTPRTPDMRLRLIRPYSTPAPFPCLLQSLAQFLEALDSSRGEDTFAASKMSIQNRLAVGNFVG